MSSQNKKVKLMQKKKEHVVIFSFGWFLFTFHFGFTKWGTSKHSLQAANGKGDITCKEDCCIFVHVDVQSADPQNVN